MEVVGKLRWAAALVLCVGSPVAGQSSGLDRPHDPVVLDGSRAAQLHGVNVGRLVAFRWQTDWVQVPLQVDERFEVPYQTVFQGYNVNTSLTLLSYADANTYTGADPDAAFDADDELAFMASGAGERAPLLAPPPAGTLGTGLELLLTDPLDGAVGYVYVYESDGSLLPSAGQDAVSYQFNLLAGPYIPNYATWGGGNPEDSVIATPAYRVHFSERWVRDELALFAGGASGVDVLDRHRFSQAPTVCNRTEDSFSDGVGAFFANIDGPVRAIRSYMGANSGPLTQRVHRFYAQREDVAMIYRVHAIGRAGLDLFDYRPDAAGMSYSNSLNPVPVPIDGVPEPMALGDLEWELVDGPHGSLIHAHRVATDFPTTLTSYYSDHVTPPTPPCSGDASDYAASGSYGVSPLQNTDPRNTPTYNYVRERTIYYGAPGQDVATATLRAAQANAPLSVGVRDHVAAGDVARYCTASSTTCGSPSIGATGVPLASASSGFVIAASNVRAGKPAILLYSNAGAASIPWTYGTLCVNHPRRAPTMVAVGTPNQCDGVVSLDMNGFAAGVLGGDPKAYLTVPGTLVNCQWWGRTSAQEEPFLSDALSYVVQAEPAPIDAVLSTVVVLPSQNVTANGIDDATVLVTLRDTYGNPVAGESVRIDASGANNTILQPIGPTDANGVTTGNVSSWTAETKTVTVTLVSGNTPVLLNAAPTVRFVGDPATIDLALSSATATPASVLANGVATATVSVTVRDANNNVVPRQQVLISASGGNNTLNQPLGPTDADGVATALVASTLAQTKTITAVVNPQSSPVILAQQPTVVFSRDPSTINGALSSAVATPTAGLVANGVVKTTLTVTVRDAFGNPVPGQVVQLAATGSGNTLLQPTEPTDANGQATGTLASYIAGQKQISVTVNPQGSAVVLDDEPMVAFVGDPATIQPGLSSAVAVPAAGVLANGVAQSTVTVTVRDANGNVVAGQNVQLAATGAGNSIVQPGITNAGGVASGTIASTAAGTKTLTVTVNPQGSAVVLSTQPLVAFVADPGTISASLSSAAAVPASGVVANGTALSTVTVTVRDAFGNPVAGQTVQLAATGTGNTLVQPAGPTNASGVASGTLASTQAATKTLTVTVNPQGAPVVLNEHPTVVFVPGAPHPGLSGVAAVPSSGILANGSALSTVTVIVRDAFGNPVAGQTVQLSATGTGNTLVQPASPTDANGIATGTLASTKAEAKTVTATVDPQGTAVVLSTQPTAAFVADPSTISASLSSAVAAPASGILANGSATSTVTVTVRDAFGNPVAGQTVQLAATGSSNTLVQPAGPTNASGVASGTLASTKAETKTLTATVNPQGSAVVVNEHPTVVFVPGAPHPGLSSVAAVPSAGILANGAELSTVTVIVRDAFGNPIAGQAVQLAATGTGNTLVQPAGPTSASGVATGTMASTKAETKTVTATVNPQGTPVILGTQPTVAFVADSSTISPSLSSAGAIPASGVLANGTTLATVTVTVRDAFGNPVPGQTVQLAATGTSNTLVQPAGPTDASGVASGTLASTKAEAKTLTAIVNPQGTPVILGTQPTVAFVADSSTISPSLSSAGAIPASGVLANGTTLATVTVTVRDAFGNPVPGQTVQLAATGTSNTLVQPAGPTDATGVASGTLASTKAEAKTLTATVNPQGTPVILGTQPTVAFVADPSTLSASLSTAVAAPSSGVPANGVSTSTITVTARDAFGNPVAGQTVQVAATGSGNTLVQPSGPTNPVGVATATIASSVVQTKTITVTVNPAGSPVVLSNKPTVDFVPVVLSPVLSSAVAAPTFGALADAVQTVTITVTTRDTGGSPMAGQTVSISSTGSGNALVQPASPTGANGVATASIASSLAESKLITVTINPGPSQVVLSDKPTTEFIWLQPGVFYVRKSGSNLNPGTSPSKAWATLTHAASVVGAGNTVYVGAGTYTESIPIAASGTAQSPIAFIADTTGVHAGDAGAVTVNGGGATRAFHVAGASYVLIDGFTLTGASYGIQASGPAAGLVLRNNSLYGNNLGIEVIGFNGATLESNRVSNNGTTGISLDSTANAVVRNNLVYNNGGTGLFLRAGSTLVEGNTLHLNGGDNLFVRETAAGTNVRNNILTQAIGDGVEVLAGAVISNSFNLAWGNGGLDWKGVSPGTGSINQNPGFVDPDGADNLLGGANAADDRFQLGVPSPAQDAGSGLADTIVLNDGTTFADLTTRLDALLDGNDPDANTLNLGHHYVPASAVLQRLDDDDGRLFYGLKDATDGERQPRMRMWDDQVQSWSTSGLGLPTGSVTSTIQGMTHEASPLDSADELLAVLSSNATSTELDVQRWTGAEWALEWTANGIPVAHAQKRSFDVAYESLSGDALVVYSSGTATPLFRTRTAGKWSAEMPLPLNDGAGPFPNVNSAAVLWIELESQQNGNQIALAYVDLNDDLVAIVWDGSQWSTATAATLETAVKENAITGVLENRAFDLGYTGTSGNLLVAWGRLGQLGFVWSSKNAGSNTWSTPAIVSAGFGDESDFVDLAPEPGGERIAAVFCDLEGVPERLSFGMWSNAWVDVREVVNQMRDANALETGDYPAALGWVGTSGVAACVFADDETGALDWVRWTSASGWTEMPNVPIAGKGFTESVLLRSGRKNALMAALSDSKSDLYTAICGGTTWTLANGGAALETELVSNASLPFSLFLSGRVPAKVSMNVRVITGNDDAEDRSNSVSLTSDDLELGDGDSNEAEGLRFQGLAIPQGATITSAWLEFKADEEKSGTTNLTFAGEDIDDAPPFTSANNNILNRTRTSATVAWNAVPAWSTKGQLHQTPDLAAIIQEIVSRPGWASGNDLVIIVTGTGNRVAESYEGDAAGAPLLHVEYAQ